MPNREFDIIVWGATGFTGQLVAEYLANNYGVGGDLRWAIGGRNRDKLEEVRSNCVPGEGQVNLPLVIADSADPDSLRELAGRTRVVCTTVGPYARYGTPLVNACIEAGSHYCDLTGEVQWMARLIPEMQSAAAESGSRIVHTCGFDSVPSDMGTWFLQQVMQEKHGKTATEVKARVASMRGGASGGTIASMLNMMEEAAVDPSIRKVMANPYALYPPGEQPGLDQGDQSGAVWDEDFNKWTSPFIMAAINTRVVRRSNALLGFPWGREFRYDESLLAKSRFSAVRNSAAGGIGLAAMAIGPTRKLLSRFLPQPGQGPSKEQREAGSYELQFLGKAAGGKPRAAVCVRGHLDPGYGSTSRMLGEAAVCLAKDESSVPGGFWTPASALGASYLQRLQERAGLDFEEIDPDQL